MTGKEFQAIVKIHPMGGFLFGEDYLSASILILPKVTDLIKLLPYLLRCYSMLFKRSNPPVDYATV